MLNEDQKFVNEVLDRSEYDIKWLASKLHMEYDLVRYQLRSATNYRQDVHAKILDIFKQEGLITSNKEHCDKLKDEMLDFSSVLSGSLSILSRSVKEKIKDMNLSDEEKNSLKKEIRIAQGRTNDSFNDLLITIDLK
jgi:hypothetical protein